MSDSDLAGAMDLCVSCKGSRRECENEVDMALRRTLWVRLPKLLNWPLLAHINKQ